MRELLAIAKALSDESRLRAVMFLADGELCVCRIVEMLGLAPSTVSRHMAVLHRAGLVESRKEGRWIYYRLASDEPSACIREAISWVRTHLRGDSAVVADSRRLRRVCEMSQDELCARRRG